MPVGSGVPVPLSISPFTPCWTRCPEGHSPPQCPNCLLPSFPKATPLPGIHSHTALTHSLLLMSSPEPWAQQWLKARKRKVPLEWWGPGQCNHHHSTVPHGSFCSGIKFWERLCWCKLVAEYSLQSQVYIGWGSSFPLCSYKSQQDQKIPPSSWEYKTTQECTKEFPKLNWEIADMGLWRCKHIFFL